MGALYSWPFEVSTVENGMVKVIYCVHKLQDEFMPLEDKVTS